MTEKFKYHYVIGIAPEGKVTYNNDNPQFYMKYFYTFTEEMWDKFRLAIEMSKNKLWKTDINKSLDTTNSKELCSNLQMMLISVKVNRATIHHFMSNTEISEEWFDELPNSIHGKKLLEKSELLRWSK